MQLGAIQKKKTWGGKEILPSMKARSLNDQAKGVGHSAPLEQHAKRESWGTRNTRVPGGKKSAGRETVEGKKE